MSALPLEDSLRLVGARASLVTLASAALIGATVSLLPSSDFLTALRLDAKRDFLERIDTGHHNAKTRAQY